MKYNTTIMVPAFNAEKFLPESLSSALNQTYSGDYEILVIDDGSFDSTPKIAEDFSKGNSNMRVLHQKNQGISVTRNRLLEESRGEILLGLDADDRLHPNALEKIINFHKENPKIGFVYTDNRCINEQGEILYEGRKTECHKFFDNLIYFSHFPGHLKSFKKSVLHDVRFDASLITAEDWDFLLKLTPFIKKGHIPEILYDYRININGASRSASKKNRREITKNMLKKHIISHNLYPHAKNIEIIRIAAGEHAIYYEHIVDDLPMMNLQTKDALTKYFSSYKN